MDNKAYLAALARTNDHGEQVEHCARCEDEFAVQPRDEECGFQDTALDENGYCEDCADELESETTCPNSK